MASYLQTIITKSCQAKADVVCKDEKEAGLRAILNYGHTIAHGIESLTGYTRINHGEAVAMGMVAAGSLLNWECGRKRKINDKRR
jgi:3-dehydroquinate synthase